MKPENLTCPECGGPMESRLNRSTKQRFWGCKNFPQCTGTRNTDGEARAPRQAWVPKGEDDEQLPSERWNGRDRRRWDR